MTTASSQRRALGLAAPTVLLTTVASAFAAAPAQAETPAHLPTPPLTALPTGAAAVAGRIVPAQYPAATTYTVQDGDTLWDIAQAQGISVAALYEANGLGADSVIYPGQVLSLTAPVPALASLPASTSAAEASPTTSTHEVAAGDTLWSIAQQHGVALADLYAANGLSPDSIIYPGQPLRLTGPSVLSATAALPASDSYTAPQITLTHEQTTNAQHIIRVGRELGVSDRGIAIALATAMVESRLSNLPSGDRDSIGLFQQRPSTGWGSPEQIADADYATRAFFLGAPHAAGLLDIPGWESLGFSEAAQEVQISAYPGRYGLWETQAYDWLAALG